MRLYNNGTKGLIIETRTLKAFLLSLLLHLLILLLFIVGFPEVKFPAPKGEQEKKMTLQLSTFSPPPPPKPVVTPPVIPPVPQPLKKEPVKEKMPETKLVKRRQRFVTQEQNVTKTPPKKVVKKTSKKAPKKVQKRQPKKHLVKRSKPKRTKRSFDPLANVLMGSGTSMRSNTLSVNSADKIIRELYGSEFDTLMPAQKKFIKLNIGAIQRITQRTLTRNGYPDVAIRTEQQGTNVISFYLHPNGDISDLRLTKNIGYAALDENTLEVIRIAYKDYPKPIMKTKIVFYVTYEIMY